MSALDQIVNVVISQQTTAVPQQGFGIPLIIGTSGRMGSDRIRYYSSTAGMLSDGFLVGDPEYIYAQKAFSQALTPTLVGIGAKSTDTFAQAVANIQQVSDLWYGVAICANDATNIKAVAAQVESMKKIFIACTADADVPTSSSTDVGSFLKTQAYKRTAYIYSPEANEGKDAAWLGGQLPQTPGASTWKFKELVSTTVDTFTDSKRTILIGVPETPGKNANIYETVGGVPITEEGWMAGGQFIDITVGLDWLESTMKTNVYAVLVNAPKVPYTNQGAALIENAVRQTLLQGAANGLIDVNSIVVTAEDVLAVSSNDRANRFYPGITFSARLAGAFHYVKINGTVTV